MSLPTLTLARHGATEWSIARRHTGLTDLPLAPEGEAAARALAPRLAGLTPALVLVSGLRRAQQTAHLAGFAEAAVEPDLNEWDYGDYEGQTTAEILARRPGWELFRDGCPGGEDAAAVGRRADRVLARAQGVAGPVLLFASAHVLRVLAARFLGFDPAGGRLFALDTASLSVLGYEHDDPAQPVVRLWNQTRA